MATYTIALIPGDGIGPEVMPEALKVLDVVARRYSHTFVYTEDIVGGGAIDRFGTPLRPETTAMCRRQHAVLFGAVGGPKWDHLQGSIRPEQGLLGLRKGLGLFANIRPTKVYPFLADQTAFKPEVIRQVDLVVIRESTGGLYFGRPQKRWRDQRGRKAVDTLKYSEGEIERLVRLGFEMARARRKKVTSVDKANVLASSQLWREVAIEVGRDYPDVALDHLLVDACAMSLIREPASFDVIVTENLFGDILTDEASTLAGSIGMSPSASVGKRRANGTGRGLYEPIHGSAPDIAGQGIANPVAMILSAALMLRLSFGLEREAAAVEQAMEAVLRAGHRTKEIATAGQPYRRTAEMGDLVVEALGEARALPGSDPPR